MALHDATDPQARALRLLLGGGLNAELEPETGEPVVRATYGWPAIDAQRVHALAHPALAIWRETETSLQRSVHHVDELVTWRIDYALPATPLEHVDARWELLQEVWATILRLVRRGHHPAVADDASLLVDAGFVEVDMTRGREPRVQYLLPATDRAVFPAFQGRIHLRHRDDIDISGLPYASLLAHISPPDLPEDERPLVGALLERPSFTAGPTITGTPEVGEVLVVGADLDGTSPISLTYEWRRDGTPIEGADEQSYEVDPDDAGAAITCLVVATNDWGTTTAESAVVEIPAA